MSDTNTLIKNITVDIIRITTVWGLIGLTYQEYNHNYRPFNILNYRVVLDKNLFFYFSLFSGAGTSLYLMQKYK